MKAEQDFLLDFVPITERESAESDLIFNWHPLWRSFVSEQRNIGSQSSLWWSSGHVWACAFI
jgi:capsule polysaccharide modification protein KpsS